MPPLEQDGHGAGLQKIPLLETSEVSNQSKGRAGDAASLPGYTWGHHRKFALIATLCWCKDLMTDLGMLRLNPT